MVMNDELSPELGFQVLGGGIIAGMGEGVGAYPKGTEAKWRKQREEKYQYMSDRPVNATEESIRKGIPSLNEEEDISRGLRSGAIPTTALNQPIILNVDVHVQDGKVTSQNVNQQSPTNSKVGEDHGRRTTPFSWGGKK